MCYAACSLIDTAAKNKKAPFVLPLLSFNQPMSDGPKNPPTLKAVFTNAMPAAATVSRLPHKRNQCST